MYEILCQQAQEVSTELRRKHLAGRTVTLKLKFYDFRTITRSKTSPEYLDDASAISKIAADLLNTSDAGKIPVRLIGLTVSHFPAQDLKVAERGGELYQPCFSFCQEKNG